MAKPRESLSVAFHELCDNVFFQPPTGTKLKYPCILYELSDIDISHADNYGYLLHDKYSVTYITRDPDDRVIHDLARLPFCMSDRMFVKDNLYHYSYTIYR